MKSPQPHTELFTVMREFTLESDRYVERVASLHGLHRTDLNALGFLVRPSREGNTMTPGKLGDALNLSSPATTALVDRLARSGHVVRQRDQADRRQIQLSMTEHARNVGRTLFLPLAMELGGAVQNYTPEELELVERFLRDMTAATSTARENLKAPEAREESGAPAQAAH
ncbi:MarR family winged helix-turn-helix transcriptional regulator [Arthrobacter glacialis]|nr:MarR family transcriptional regulator [Arthrobacter glacialis]